MPINIALRPPCSCRPSLSKAVDQPYPILAYNTIAVVFIELLFVFQSLWSDKSGYYYVFGFLAVISTILILAVMETTIIAVYIQLCSEVSSHPDFSLALTCNRMSY